MTDREVGDLIRALGMMWPTVPVRDFDEKIQVGIWAAVLRDVSYAEAVAIAVEHSRTGTAFPPAVGVIAERAMTMREKAAGTYAPDGDQALAEVMAGVRRGGINLLDPKRVPRHEWSHPAVATAVRAMGWRDICLSDKPDVVRAQFLRVYADARARITAERRRTPEMRALMAPPRTEIPTTTGETHDEPDDTEHPARTRRGRTGRAALAAVRDGGEAAGTPRATAG